MKILSQNGLIGQTGSVVVQPSTVLPSDTTKKSPSLLDYTDQIQQRITKSIIPAVDSNWQVKRTLTSSTYISNEALTRLKQGYSNESNVNFISPPSKNFNRNGVELNFNSINDYEYDEILQKLENANLTEKDFKDFLNNLLGPGGLIDHDLKVMNMQLGGLTDAQFEVRQQLTQEPDNKDLQERLSYLDKRIQTVNQAKENLFHTIHKWKEETPTKLWQYPGIALEKVQDVFNAWLSRNGFGDTSTHGMVGKTAAVGDGIKTGMMIGNVINTARVGVGAYQGLSPGMKKTVTHVTRMISADMPAKDRYAIIKKVQKAGDISNAALGWVDNLFSTPIINIADKIRPGLRKEILESATHHAQKIAGAPGAGTVGKTLGRTSLGTALAAYSVGYYGATGLRINFIDDNIDGTKYKIRPSDSSRNAALVAGALNVAAISVADIGATPNHTLGTTVTLAAVGSELVAEYFIYQDKKMMEDVHHLLFKAEDGPTLRKGFDAMKRKYGSLKDIAPVLGLTGDKQSLKTLLESKIQSMVDSGEYSAFEAQQVLNEIFQEQ